MDAWERIDRGLNNGDAGLVWEGTLLLAKFEQGVPLQEVLGGDPALWAQATAWKELHSPIPGDESTFQSFRIAPDATEIPDDASFGDGTIYGDTMNGDPLDDGVARYLWFRARMVPAWKDNVDAWRKSHGEIDLNKLLNGEYMQRP